MTSPEMTSTITMHPVESSNIAAIGYDPETKELRVRFTSGATYSYAKVAAASWEQFLAAGSKGTFFARHIRPIYPYTKVS